MEFKRTQFPQLRFRTPKELGAGKLLQRNSLTVLCFVVKQLSKRLEHERTEEKHCWLCLVFLTTLLLCSSCFLDALQQDRAQSRLL